MNLDRIISYCESFPGTTFEFPFDKTTLVIKVLGKMFLLIDIEESTSFNVKCDPEQALELRERYASVRPGYHMNKTHWNTITINGELDEKELRHWIKHSYDLVVSKLPKKQRDELSH